MTRPGQARVGAGALAAAVGSLVVLAGAILFVRFRPRRVVVEGRSMEPTLAPGDRLLVVGTPRVRPGDVVAVRDPRQGGRVLVKRVGAVLGDEVVLRGDNEAASTDSREFGPVPAGAVLGRVVRCYAPPWRAGPVR
ncbi:MAG: nickel-type superoxide dismutase maturation protease [Acidimicrobiales bacterium]